MWYIQNHGKRESTRDDGDEVGGSLLVEQRAGLDKIIHKGRTRRREGQRDKLVYAEFR